MLSITVLLVIVAAASLLATEVRVHNNGDIRLVNHWGDDDHSGRLEIFIDGHWGTICGKHGTNFKAVTETACRQLGFDLSDSPIVFYGTVTKLGFPVANNSTPIHFGSINCGSSTSSIFDNYCSTNYHQHVLRCAVDTKVNATACTHRNDIGVTCPSYLIIEKIYKGQLFLYTTGGQGRSLNVSLSSGGLAIFFEKSDTSKVSLVCGKGFDKNAANTACRQLGYTNANHFNTSLLNQTTNYTFWDAGLNCKSQSHSCLNNCFSKTPTNQTSCKNWVSLSCCEFNLSLKNTEASGSPRLCDAAVDDSCKPDIEDYTVTIPIVVAVVVIVVILVACASCITLLVCCLVPGCLIHRKRTGYQSVN